MKLEKHQGLISRLHGNAFDISQIFAASHLLQIMMTMWPNKWFNIVACFGFFLTWNVQPTGVIFNGVTVYIYINFVAKPRPSFIFRFQSYCVGSLGAPVSSQLTRRCLLHLQAAQLTSMFCAKTNHQKQQNALNNGPKRYHLS